MNEVYIGLFYSAGFILAVVAMFAYAQLMKKAVAGKSFWQGVGIVVACTLGLFIAWLIARKAGEMTGNGLPVLIAKLVAKQAPGGKLTTWLAAMFAELILWGFILLLMEYKPFDKIKKLGRAVFGVIFAVFAVIITADMVVVLSQFGNTFSMAMAIVSVLLIVSIGWLLVKNWQSKLQNDFGLPAMYALDNVATMALLCVYGYWVPSSLAGNYWAIVLFVLANTMVFALAYIVGDLSKGMRQRTMYKPVMAYSAVLCGAVFVCFGYFAFKGVSFQELQLTRQINIGQDKIENLERNSLMKDYERIVKLRDQAVENGDKAKASKYNESLVAILAKQEEIAKSKAVLPAAMRRHVKKTGAIVGWFEAKAAWAYDKVRERVNELNSSSSGKNVPGKKISQAEQKRKALESALAEYTRKWGHPRIIKVSDSWKETFMVKRDDNFRYLSVISFKIKIGANQNNYSAATKNPYGGRVMKYEETPMMIKANRPGIVYMWLFSA